MVARQIGLGLGFGSAEGTSPENESTCGTSEVDGADVPISQDDENDGTGSHSKYKTEISAPSVYNYAQLHRMVDPGERQWWVGRGDAFTTGGAGGAGAGGDASTGSSELENYPRWERQARIEDSWDDEADADVVERVDYQVEKMLDDSEESGSDSSDISDTSAKSDADANGDGNNTEGAVPANQNQNDQPSHTAVAERIVEAAEREVLGEAHHKDLPPTPEQQFWNWNNHFVFRDGLKAGDRIRILVHSRFDMRRLGSKKLVLATRGTGHLDLLQAQAPPPLQESGGDNRKVESTGALDFGLSRFVDFSPVFQAATGGYPFSNSSGKFSLASGGSAGVATRALGWGSYTGADRGAALVVGTVFVSLGCFFLTGAGIFYWLLLAYRHKVGSSGARTSGRGRQRQKKGREALHGGATEKGRVGESGSGGNTADGEGGGGGVGVPDAGGPGAGG